MVEKMSYIPEYGTRVSTSDLEIVKVVMGGSMISNFSIQYACAMQLANPIRYASLDKVPERLHRYLMFLLQTRLDYVNNRRVPWRELKALFVPWWMAYCLTRIGKYLNRNYGFEVVPDYEPDGADGKYDIQDAHLFSEVLASFKDDGFELVQNAFPSSYEGDPDVMSMVILSSYIHGMKDVTPSVAGYIAGFVDAHLVDETAFKALYRVRYDDLAFIGRMLTTDSKLR